MSANDKMAATYHPNTSTVDDWPFLSREDRAKRVAIDYRSALHRIASGSPTPARIELEILDRRQQRRGAHWIVPRPPEATPDEDDWLTAADAAAFADVQPKTLRKWVERGKLKSQTADDGSPLYRAGDLIALDRDRRHDRRSKHTG